MFGVSNRRLSRQVVGPSRKSWSADLDKTELDEPPGTRRDGRDRTFAAVDTSLLQTLGFCHLAVRGVSMTTRKDCRFQAHLFHGPVDSAMSTLIMFCCSLSWHFQNVMSSRLRLWRVQTICAKVFVCLSWRATLDVDSRLTTWTVNEELRAFPGRDSQEDLLVSGHGTGARRVPSGGAVG